MQRFYFKRVSNGYSTSIVFELEVLPITNTPPEGLPIVNLQDNIFVYSSVNELGKEEIHYIQQGLEKVYADIIKKSHLGLRIHIVAVYWALVDYQSDLWELAIAEWASKYFHFPIPDNKFWANKSHEKKRFEFVWV